MHVDSIKYDRLKVQAREILLPGFQFGYRGVPLLLYFADTAGFFLNKLKVVAIMYGPSLAASFFFKQHLLTLSLLYHISLILTIF